MVHISSHVLPFLQESPSGGVSRVHLHLPLTYRSPSTHLPLTFRSPSVLCDQPFVDIFLTLFVDTFCGHFLWTFLWTLLWTLFVDTFCKHFLETLFVYTFCRDLLTTLFVDTLYGRFLSVFVHFVVGATIRIGPEIQRLPYAGFFFFSPLSTWTAKNINTSLLINMTWRSTLDLIGCMPFFLFSNVFRFNIFVSAVPSRELYFREFPCRCQPTSIWVEPGRKGKGQKNGNFTLYILGSLDHLYIFCFAGNCHVFEAYRGESYYGI